MTSGIFIGLGANLPHPRFGSPLATLKAALAALDGHEIALKRRSPWYRSAPVPVSDQPWFVNGIAEIETALSPADLLARLHAIEADFGRDRAQAPPNAPRAIDLDLIAYGDRVLLGPEPPILPHPRLGIRGFVLYPLRDLAPDWRHPETGRDIAAMIADLPKNQEVLLLPRD